MKDGKIVMAGGETDREGCGNASLCVGKRLGRSKKKARDVFEKHRGLLRFFRRRVRKFSSRP